jgi:hypothetical protein
MLDNTRGAIERWVDSLTGVDQNPVAAIRLATEQLETALNRLQLAPIADARFDPNALQDCAERVARIADRSPAFYRSTPRPLIRPRLM